MKLALPAQKAARRAQLTRTRTRSEAFITRTRSEASLTARLSETSLTAASARTKNAAALHEPRHRLTAGGRRSTVYCCAVRLPCAGDGVLQRSGWLRRFEDGTTSRRRAAGHSCCGRARVSREAGPRADAAADVGRRSNTRGAWERRGPLRAATDRKRRVRHGTRPASSIGFSWSAFDRV